MNKAIIIGNLTDNIDLRQTQSKKYVTSFSIAVNDGYGDKRITDYIDCVAWEKTAELLSKFCSKGSKICVEGKIKKDSYEKNGQKMYRTYVSVNNVEFLTKAEQPSDELLINEEDLPF